MNKVAVRFEHSCFSPIDVFVCEVCGQRTGTLDCYLSEDGKSAWICPKCRRNYLVKARGGMSLPNICMK